MKKLEICLLLLIFGAFFGVLGFFLCYETHESSSFEQISFTIDRPYLEVVQNLAKKDSLEKIVEQNDATLVEKSWKNFNIEVPQRVLRIKEYTINGVLDFVIEKHDKFLGNLNIPFTQSINFDKNMLKIDTKLQKNHEKVTFYEKNVEITPFLSENKTFVEIKSKLSIKNKIPFFAKEIMDKKVNENNKNDVKKLENNLKNMLNKVKVNIFRAKQEILGW
jgi:hypothetical protein